MARPAPLALSLVDVVKRYPDPEGGSVCVLDVPELRLASGDRLAVHGESGSGKTTLLHVAAGILPPDEGHVEVMGEPMSGRGEPARDRLRARYVGYVFQTFHLLPQLTAWENVALGMTFRSTPGADVGTRAREALVRVGLEGRVHHRPHQLSVGQRQRVAIARALAGRPGHVLVDEPTANLDARRAHACLDLLLAFADECGAAVLAVTHDPAVLRHFPRHHELRAPGASAEGTP